MAQVNLDVVYNVKGLSALKSADQQMKQAGNAASTGANNIKKFDRSLAAIGPAAKGSAAGIQAIGSVSGFASAGVKALGASVAAAMGPIAAATAVLGAFTAGMQTIVGLDFSNAKLKSLGVDAQDLAGQLKGVTAELDGQASRAELTGAAYDVASAGFTNAADAANVLKAASLGATGGFSDINTVANATTSVLNAYGKSASEAGRLVDGFIQTQNDGKIVIGEYAANISKVAPVAAALGIELGEVNAIISQVTATGTGAEVAFTGLKTALAQLASGNANKALEEIGVNISAADIEAEGLIGVLTKIKESGVDVGTAFKAFGNEAAPVLQAVFNDLDKTNQLLDNQKNSAGAAASAQKTAADTIQGAWKSVQNAFSDLFADQEAFGVVIKQTLNVAAQLIKDLAAKINLVLAPVKLLIQAFDFVRTKAEQVVDAFKQGLQQSEGWQKLSKLFAAIGKYIQDFAKELLEKAQPAFKKVLEWATKLGEYIGNKLFGAVDKLIGGFAKVMRMIPGLKNEGKALATAWENFKKQIDSSNVELKKATEEGKDEVEDLKDELLVAADAAGVFASQLQTALNTEMGAINNVQKAQNAIYQTQGTILNIKKQAAQADLDAAKTDEERESAAKRIYDIAVKQADLTYKSTVSAAKAEEEKVAAQARYMKGQIKLQEMKLKEAEAAGKVTEAHYEAVDAAMGAYDLAVDNLGTQVLVTDAIIKGADAQRQAEIEAAKTALQANRVKEATDGAANAASRLADEYGRAAGNANAAAGASRSSSVTTTQVSYAKSPGFQDQYKIEDGKIVERTDKEINDDILQIELDQKNARARQQFLNTKYSVGYAKGGYVDTPTQALIGEGVEGEYIIPESKLAAAMSNYAAGKRGSAVVPDAANVSVEYNGSTVEMGGTSYINRDDVNGIVSKAVNATLTTLKKSPKARLEAGMR